ncbi:MAG: hypothetical protein WC337_02590 [Candidatus Muiribacteriota bacterium]
MFAKLRGRIWILVFYVFLICFFSWFYSNFYSYKVIDRYNSDGMFKNLFFDINYNTLWLEKKYPDYFYFKVDSTNKWKKEVLNGNGGKFINLYEKNPRAGIILNNLNLEQQRVVINYSDTFEEFYGYYKNPLWNFDDFYDDYSFLYSVSRKEPLYMEVENRLKMIEHIKGEALEYQNDKDLYGNIYNTDLPKSEINIEEKEGFYFFCYDSKGELQFQTFIKENNISSIYVKAYGANIAVITASDEKITVFKSYNRGKTFEKNETDFKVNSKKLFVLSHNANLMIVSQSDNKLTVYLSEDLGFSTFRKIDKNIKNTVKSVDFDFENGLLGCLETDNTRDFIVFYRVGEDLIKEKIIGNIYSESLNNIVFTGRKSLIYQKQVSDNEFIIVERKY